MGELSTLDRMIEDCERMTIELTKTLKAVQRLQERKYFYCFEDYISKVKKRYQPKHHDSFSLNTSSGSSLSIVTNADNANKDIPEDDQTNDEIDLKKDEEKSVEEEEFEAMFETPSCSLQDDSGEIQISESVVNVDFDNIMLNARTTRELCNTYGCIKFRFLKLKYGMESVKHQMSYIMKIANRLKKDGDR